MEESPGGPRAAVTGDLLPRPGGGVLDVDAWDSVSMALGGSGRVRAWCTACRWCRGRRGAYHEQDR